MCRVVVAERVSACNWPRAVRDLAHACLESWPRAGRTVRRGEVEDIRKLPSIRLRSPCTTGTHRNGPKRRKRTAMQQLFDIVTSNYLLRRCATQLWPAIAKHPPCVSSNLAPRPRHCPHQTAWNGSMRNRSIADHRVRAHGNQNAPRGERVLEMQSNIGGSSDEQVFGKEC